MRLKRALVLFLLCLVLTAPGCRALAAAGLYAGAVALDAARDDDDTWQPGVHDYRNHRHHHRRR